MKKLNERYHRFTRFVAFVIVLVSVIGFFWKGLEPLMAIYDKWKIGNIKYSHQDSILHEINTARNKLDLILCYSQQKTKTQLNISLDQKTYILESFSDNLTMKKDLIDLYDALSSAKISADRLMTLIEAKAPNPTDMQNREADIKEAIDSADKIGPRVAKEIGGRWEVPPSNMPEMDRIKYHVAKMRPSIATAPAEVQSK